VLFFLYIAVFFVVIFAWFAILFTGRYPRSAFDFVVGVARWHLRVTAYMFILVTDKYPPFSLEADPTYPARFEISYPEEGIARWRPLVHWLLVIPYAIVAGLLSYVAGVVAFIGIFVILFTKNLPEGMFNLILIPNRWYARVFPYAGFMVDRYPPFNWEE
jgi:hypothetical protein